MEIVGGQEKNTHSNKRRLSGVPGLQQVHEWRWLMEENAPKRSFDSISKEWAVVAAVMSVVPVYFLVSHFTDDGRALVASCSAGMIVLVARYFWDLRKHVWFWVTIAFFVFIHVLLVVFLPPPAKQWNYVHWNYVQMLPFGLLDFAIAYGIIRLVEKVADRSS